MEASSYGLFNLNKNDFIKETHKLKREIYKLNVKIDKLYEYIYHMQKYLTTEMIKEINEECGDLLNED